MQNIDDKIKIFKYIVNITLKPSAIETIHSHHIYKHNFASALQKYA